MIFNRDEYEYEELGNFDIESEEIENINLSTVILKIALFPRV